MADTVLPDGRRLKQHQVNVLNHYADLARQNNTPKKGLIVAHRMGAGKTLTALCTAKMLLRSGSVTHVYVVAPKSVVDYWGKVRAEVGLSPRQVTVDTHVHGLRNLCGIASDSAMLIVDEAHKLRTAVADPDKRRADKGDKSVDQSSWELLEVCSRVRFVMLLTGTPVVNNIGDLRNLIAAIHGMRYDTMKARLAGFADRNEVYAYGRNRPSLAQIDSEFGRHRYLFREAFSMFYTLSDEIASRMPACTREEVLLEMSPAYATWYEEIEARVAESMPWAMRNKNTKIFYNGVRRAINCNAPSGVRSPKYDFLYAKFRECVADRLSAGQPVEKIILYSFWREFGADIIKDILTGLRLQYAIVDGGMTAKARQASVDAFNRDDVHVLIYTSAGGEGLDLKGTRHVIVMEPHWNMALMNQAIARAVRMDSHVHLPVDQRDVHVQFLLGVKPPAVPGESVDVKLMTLAKAKDEWDVAEMQPFMKRYSIEEGKQRADAVPVAAPVVPVAAPVVPVPAAPPAPVANRRRRRPDNEFVRKVKRALFARS